MMEKFEFIPKGVCSRKITFCIEDEKIYNLTIEGGCPGNGLAVAKLIEGKNAKEIAGILKGNKCGFRNTSCADQLSIAIERALNEDGI